MVHWTSQLDTAVVQRLKTYNDWYPNRTMAVVADIRIELCHAKYHNLEYQRSTKAIPVASTVRFLCPTDKCQQRKVYTIWMVYNSILCPLVVRLVYKHQLRYPNVVGIYLCSRILPINYRFIEQSIDQS